MHRIGYIFEEIVDMDNLRYAFKCATKGKRNKYYVKKIAKNLDYWLEQLRTLVLNDEFTSGDTRLLSIVEHPSGKIREIEIPTFFPDHILHWAICLVLIPKLKQGMCRWCVGSVPGRGNYDGYKKVRKILKEDHSVKAVAKFDLRKFFMNISVPKLKYLFTRKIKDKRALKLIYQVLDGVKSSGLPIGFYTSQWFSNFYLEEVDHFIKEQLHVKYYIRNVDDLLLMDESVETLQYCREQLTLYLQTHDYAVELKPSGQIWPVHSRPIDFLGYKFYNNKIIMRSGNFYRLMRKVNRVRIRGYCTLRLARGISSGIGVLKTLPNGLKYYFKHIKNIISKEECSRIISIADKRKLKGATI